MRDAAPSLCGWCADSIHDGCKVVIRVRVASGTRLWFCACPECQGKADQPWCLSCRATGDVDPVAWSCRDQVACKSRVQQQLDDDPVVQRIEQIRESAKMAKVEQQKAATETKAAAAPKVGKCLVTGEPTKGGKFKPGMDARYVSIKVASVLEGKATEAQVIKEMEGHELSPTLQNKFRKGLRLGREKAEKAKAAAKEKATAKAEKASASA